MGGEGGHQTQNLDNIIHGWSLKEENKQEACLENFRSGTPEVDRQTTLVHMYAG